MSIHIENNIIIIIIFSFSFHVYIFISYIETLYSILILLNISIVRTLMNSASDQISIYIKKLWNQRNFYKAIFFKEFGNKKISNRQLHLYFIDQSTSPYELSAKKNLYLKWNNRQYHYYNWMNDGKLDFF